MEYTVPTDKSGNWYWNKLHSYIVFLATAFCAKSQLVQHGSTVVEPFGASG